MLSQCSLIGFIPTSDAARARQFYVETLGLRFVSDDQFATVVQAGGSKIRIANVGAFTPMPFTILGWEVADIAAEVATLTVAGVVFSRYPFLEQDEAGIWTAPSGDRVAWFQDPDGNTLSLSQHVGAA
jgi:catechol 2,3-dioxygenase-like lactoylglutathione lyase family enzyme